MTSDEKDELCLLDLADDNGRFALEIGPVDPVLQKSLERLQIKRWISLVDVAPLSAYRSKIYRIFMASDEAMAWRAKQRGVLS